MVQKTLRIFVGEFYTGLFALCMGGIYLLPALFGNSPYQPTAPYFLAFLSLFYLQAVLFRSCYKTRVRRLASLPDRMEPEWLFKLTVFCVEWVKAVAGAVLVVWWFGGLFFIQDFFGQHSPVIPWLVSVLHSSLLYLLAQVNVRLFDLIGFGATQD